MNEDGKTLKDTVRETASRNETAERLYVGADRFVDGEAVSTEEKNRILRARAAALAQEARVLDAHKFIDVLEFKLAGERYGIEEGYVCEIYPSKTYTRLPGLPPFVLGIVNIRGRIVSVIDIKRLLEIPHEESTDLSKLIVLGNDTMEFSILSDEIFGVSQAAIDEIQTSIPTFTGVKEKYLKGVTKEGLVILDAGKMLSDEELLISST